MVNHIRTLLLNEFPRNVTGIYVPRTFVPVPVPAALRAIEHMIFGDNTGDDKRAVVDALLPLCHTPELAPYMYKFDARVTYAGARRLRMIDMCATNAATVSEATELLGRITGTAVFGSGATALFRWPAQAQDMAALQSAAFSPTEGVLRVAAMMIAFAYQLERARTGGV